MKKILTFSILLFCSQLLIAQQSFRNLQIQLTSTSLSKINTDEIGLLHNEALEYVLSSVKIENGMQQQDFFKQYSELMSQYFSKKGIGVHYRFNGDYLALEKEMNLNICYQTQQLSEEAKSFACNIEQAFQELSAQRIDAYQFIQRMEKLRLEAERLESENERVLCGITASVAKHSVDFWNRNMDKYVQLFSGIFNEKEEGKGGPNLSDFDIKPLTPTQRIRWWSVAASDVFGAWNWGRFGTAAGGGVGIASLGLAGAAWHSGTSIITQATVKVVK